MAIENRGTFLQSFKAVLTIEEASADALERDEGRQLSIADELIDAILFEADDAEHDECYYEDGSLYITGSFSGKYESKYWPATFSSPAEGWEKRSVSLNDISFDTLQYLFSEVERVSIEEAGDAHYEAQDGGY